MREAELKQLAPAGDAALAEWVQRNTHPDDLHQYIDIDAHEREIVEVLVPEGFERHTVDLERYSSGPRRMRGTVTVRDLESFTRYVERYKSSETVVFADGSQRKATGILDYAAYAAELPGWGEWRVVLELRETTRWKAWRQMTEGWMDQADFATFVEMYARDVVEPPAADVYTLARDLKVTSNRTYERSVNEHSGSVDLIYNETVQGTNRTGKSTVPEEMTITVTPYEGGEPLTMHGYLSFRLQEGRCVFRYQIDADARDALDEYFDSLVSRLGDESDVPLFHGPAPSAQAPIAG